MIIGVDPGLSGAVAFLDPLRGQLNVEDMPTLLASGTGRRSVDAAGLARMLRGWRTDHAYVEQVSAMPGQGVSSMFSFGRSYGVVLGVLAALEVPVTLVQPRVWKQALRVPAAKDGARARASQLLPRHTAAWPLAKHDGRAEAALIAFWGVSHAGR